MDNLIYKKLLLNNIILVGVIIIYYLNNLYACRTHHMETHLVKVGEAIFRKDFE